MKQTGDISKTQELAELCRLGNKPINAIMHRVVEEGNNITES